MTFRMLAGAAIALAMPLFAGCAVICHTPLPPAHIDVDTPLGVRSGTEDDVRDPGEDVTLFGYGVWGGMGISDQGTTGGWGPELSLQIGHAPESHLSDDDLVRPMTGWGVNLGLTAQTLTRSRPLYVEAQRNHGYFWVAGGVAWDPWRQKLGGQVGGGLGPLFVRFTEMPKDERFVLIGLVAKGGVAWVEGR